MRHKQAMLLALLIGLSLVIGSSIRPSIQAQQPELGGGEPKQEAREESSGKKGKPTMQCPMMAGLKGFDLFADSPEVLRSRAEALRLSGEQIEQLKEIEESARLKAREVLTREQRGQWTKAPEGRVSIMELSQMRAIKMQKNGDGTMCPMCMRMMQKMKQQRDQSGKE